MQKTGYNYFGGDSMAKQGMSRPEWTHTQPRNEVTPVPEIQGKAKSDSKKARIIVADTKSAEFKVYHTKPHSTDESDK